MTMCQYYGCVLIQESWGTSTDPQQMVQGPIRCINCGAVEVPSKDSTEGK